MKPRYELCYRCKTLYELPASYQLWVTTRTAENTYEVRNLCEKCREELEKWLNKK